MDDIKETIEKVKAFLVENKMYVIGTVVLIVVIMALSGCAPEQWPDWANDAFEDKE